MAQNDKSILQKHENLCAKIIAAIISNTLNRQKKYYPQSIKCLKLLYIKHYEWNLYNKLACKNIYTLNYKENTEPLFHDQVHNPFI